MTTLSAILIVAGLVLMRISQSGRAMAAIKRVYQIICGWVVPYLSSQIGATPQRSWVPLAGASLIAGWILLFKLRAFFGLGTTSDLYDTMEIATTWIKGKFLYENCFGGVLPIHTYLFTPVLAIFAYPFGSLGLLFALSLAVGLNFWGTTRILRHSGVGAIPATCFAGVSGFMPLAAHFYSDGVYGFHVELLEPAMALWLTYFLLKRNWAGSLAMAVMLLGVKEEMPLLVACVGGMVFCEDFIRRQTTRRSLNLVAVAVVALAVVTLPVLLHVIKTQAATAPVVGFSRIKISVPGQAIAGPGSLWRFCLDHFGDWLDSPSTHAWVAVCAVGTFGLIFLRPHFILFGLGLSLVSWLMQDDLLWPPRFAPTLAFIQIVQVLAFASLWAVVRSSRRSKPIRFAWSACLGLAFVVFLAVSLRRQFDFTADAVEIYQERPKLHYSPSERAQADRLFATYRQESTRAEPVLASPYLFRYAHDRNLLWYFDGRQTPVWVLWDGVLQDHAANYKVVGESGRFHLYRLIR